MMNSHHGSTRYSILVRIAGSRPGAVCAGSTIESFRTRDNRVDVQAIADTATAARALSDTAGHQNTEACAAAVVQLSARFEFSTGPGSTHPLWLTRITRPIVGRDGGHHVLRYLATCTELPIPQLGVLAMANPDVAITLKFRRRNSGRGFGLTESLAWTGGVLDTTLLGRPFLN